MFINKLNDEHLLCKLCAKRILLQLHKQAHVCRKGRILRPFW